MTHRLVKAHNLLVKFREAVDSLVDLDDMARIARRTMYVVGANLVRQFSLIPVINGNDVNSLALETSNPGIVLG